jgi:hypothetical protein
MKNLIPKSIINTLFLFLVLVGVSCSKEDEKQAQPSKPILKFPRELEIDVNPEVDLQWQASNDENDDEIEYSVYYNTSPSNWILAGKTNYPFFHLSLESNTTYYWYISVSDGNTPSVDSDNRVFKTLNTNTPPIASFKVSQETGWLETKFEFDASECTDEQNRISDLKVRWDFEDDANWDAEWSTDKTVTHKYDKVGNYTVKLEVKDSEDEIVATEKQVTVNLFDPAVYGSIPSSYFQNVFIENFNDNSNNWSVGENDERLAKLENGQYEITCLKESSQHLFWHKVVNLVEGWDFQIESKIKITQSDDNSYYDKYCGLIWGHKKISIGNNNFFNFKFNVKNGFRINDNESNTVDDWSDYYETSNYINSIGNYNTITIRKYNNRYYFFINGEKVLEHQFKTFYGENIGFSIRYNTTCQIDYLYINKIGKTKSGISSDISTESGSCSVKSN